MQCAIVFTIKNKVIYFLLSIADSIQNLIKQYMHMKSHTLNKALTQNYCTRNTNDVKGKKILIPFDIDIF